MKGIKVVSCLLLLLTSTAAFSDNTMKTASSRVVQSAEIQWGYLNPLRGDKSPGAAELWGDRTQNVATGMLVKFNKGFSSPPHIHNISYRGIVIEGLMHNDDPTAQEMWMPQGSFWTQPAGENHITAASGQENLIYLEIDSGPYLVKPSTDSFDNGENPVNLHRSNMVWLKAKDVTFVKEKSGVEVSPLWGSLAHGKLGGTFIKLPAGFNGILNVEAEEFRAVIVKGKVEYQSIEQTTSTKLTSGSYFDSSGKFLHNIKTSAEALIYIRTNGTFTVCVN